jgi:hypothetical protein
MGRSLETFQKAILTALGAGARPMVRDLALRLYGWPYSNVEKANLLATLGTLQRRGLIEICEAYVPSRWVHIPNDRQAVRLPSDTPRRFPLLPGSSLPVEPHTHVTISPDMVDKYWPSLHPQRHSSSRCGALVDLALIMIMVLDDLGFDIIAVWVGERQAATL